MAKDLHKDEHVTWSSHGREVSGTVEKKITQDSTEAGRTVRASKDGPQYAVRSDASGKEAVHRPEALDRD